MASLQTHLSKGTLKEASFAVPSDTFRARGVAFCVHPNILCPEVISGVHYQNIQIDSSVAELEHQRNPRQCTRDASSGAVACHSLRRSNLGVLWGSQKKGGKKKSELICLYRFGGVLEGAITNIDQIEACSELRGACSQRFRGLISQLRPLVHRASDSYRSLPEALLSRDEGGLQCVCLKY